jgi:hypothetical protein
MATEEAPYIAIAPPRELGQLAARDEWQNKMATHNGIDGVPNGNIHEPRGIGEIDHPGTVMESLRHGLRDKSDASRSFNNHIAGKYGGIYGANTEEMLADPKTEEYLVKRGESMPTDELVSVWPEFQSTYRKGINKGIKLGYLPKVVAARFEKATRKTRVRAVDDAILRVRDEKRDIGGYYDAVDDEIGISNETPPELHVEVLAHEFGHDTAGGTFKRKPGNPATEIRQIDGFIPVGTIFDDVNISRPRAGYSTELPATKLREAIATKTGLDEAVNHHVTLGILTGDFETFDPDKREDDDDIYWDARKIYATALEKSGSLITVKMLTNGFYEDTGPEGGFSARKEVLRGFVDAYGWGAIRKLEKLYKAADDFVGQDRLEEIILSRIHGPEFGEDGQVIKQGYIDVDNLPTEKVPSIDALMGLDVLGRGAVRDLAIRRSEAAKLNPEEGTPEYHLVHASFAELMQELAASGSLHEAPRLDLGGTGFAHWNSDDEGIIDLRKSND